MTSKELQDPIGKGCCPDCLFTLSKALFDGPAIEAASQPACHDFWNACISLLTRTWTEEELAILRSTLRTSAASCPGRALSHHTFEGTNRADLDDPVHKFFHALYLCLSNNISVTHGRRTALFSSSGSKRMFGNRRRGRWPLHPNDLIPHGAPQSAEMHIHWCCQLFSPVPIATFKLLVFGCRPMILPHLVKSPLRERLLWCIVQMLNADKGRDSFLWPETVPYRLPEHLPSWLSTSSTAANVSVDFTASLLQVFTSGPDAVMGDSDKLYRGYEAALIPAVDNALDMLQAGTITLDTSSRDVLCHAAAHLHKNYPRGELHPLARLWQHMRTEENEEAPIGRLQESLKRRYYRRTCCGPSCTRGIHDTEDGKPLPLCSRCKFTQYCSKGCQMADWKRGGCSHKQLCPLLSALVPVLEKETEAFEEILRDLKLDGEALVRLFAWLYVLDGRGKS